MSDSRQDLESGSTTIQRMKGGVAMTESILNGKRILGVDDEADVLAVLEEEILGACPNTKFDKATTYEEALTKLVSRSYDLVILDVMGVRGLDLLELAESRHFAVTLLTTYPLTPEVLKRSIHSLKRMPQAYLPKEEIGGVVPLLEGMVREESSHPWRRLLKKCKGLLESELRSELMRKTSSSFHEDAGWPWVLVKKSPQNDPSHRGKHS